MPFRTVDRMMSEMPFEVLIVILCILTGLPMALGILPPPTSLIRTLPVWAVRSWGSLLSVGGITTLVGLVMSHMARKRRFIEGLYVEGAGLIILGSGALVFGLAIGATAGTRGIFSVAIYSVLTASCLFRLRTTRQIAGKMREAIELERKHYDGD